MLLREVGSGAEGEGYTPSLYGHKLSGRYIQSSEKKIRWVYLKIQLH